ncbi:protein KRI1 homolog [Diorhabda sublineata]|uniref:protein KRI1 homolog n=1 Tax=Diorhabda sublineata TaxID=1163346 RepID=UPI0024E178AC|nr:protein KRI1 homolog [Diorhabda sublineata]
MSRIFGNEQSSSDENDDFQTNNDYAKNYDTWRKKEELHKLKTKYGEDVLDKIEESSSSSDDEEGIHITEDVEKDFFKTLACLKNKDPSIYKTDVNFFGEYEANVKKKKKEKPVFLKDYERNLILEKGGLLSDEDDTQDTPKNEIYNKSYINVPTIFCGSFTYNEEQKNIKDNFKKILEENDDDNDENWGGIFKERKKTKEEVEKEESDYKLWLAGHKTKLDNTTLVNELKPLKEYWNNPDLDEGEKFLRDYILNKKYLEKEDDDYIPTYEEVVHDSDKDLSNDEENIEKQEEFEHKYNFRFEEPDQEFIKRYPRTMENSLRRTDNRRKIKRQEIKERKKKEKEEKVQEVKKLQELKLKEIEQKLEQLKEITGNANLGFANEDIEGDFDPDEYDRKMQELFNEEFYTAPEDDQKPEFPDLDEELEIENWERYNSNPSKESQPHCEDEDFNMDCDYDPSAPKNKDESTQGKKKRRKKSKFATAVAKPKPKFDPNDKKFEKYFEEYYKLDFEDIIGDIPCRFKYRKVIPNDFGLTTEEILLANERELNKWCSLKKAVQIRPDDVERYEQIAYKKKGQNINLKMKILPSLFTNSKENEITDDNVGPDKKNEVVQSGNEREDTKNNNTTAGKKKKGNKKKQKTTTTIADNGVCSHTSEGSSIVECKIDKEPENEKIKRKNKVSITNVTENGVNQTNSIETNKEGNMEESKMSKGKLNNENKNKKKNKTKKKKREERVTKVAEDEDSKVNKSYDIGSKKRNLSGNHQEENKRKKRKFSQEKDKSINITDARLSAYGVNPKKFKNKLKYNK